MTHFVKLYSSILDSTIWAEPAPTVKVWLTLLAMADANGFVDGAMLGVMRRAIVSRDECEVAIRTLESPDPDSKTPDYEGRRIERMQGGWKILNHRKYRDLRTETQVAVAERVKKHRERHPKTMLPVTHVTNVTPSNGMKRPVTPVTPEVDVDVEEETTTTPAARRNTRFAFMSIIRPVWFGCYGGDIPPGSAKLLEPLVREHGVEEVARRLKVYCEATEAPFASIYKFVSTFGSWGASPVGKTSQVRARAERLFVAFTHHGFTQNVPLETHEKRIEELAAAGKVVDPERFKAELLAVKPWTWLGSTREADKEKSISRIASALATVAA